MKKKGDIWVSAVLYIALGMVIMTLVLAAGLPVIKKMRDKNTIMQTKRVLISIDENIRTIATEGPGSRRLISPLAIDSGKLKANTNDESLEWDLTTNNKLMEPGVEFQEGPLTLKLNETIIENEYEIRIMMNYTNTANLTIASGSPIGPYQGRFSLIITHTGNFDNKGMPEISLGFL